MDVTCDRLVRHNRQCSYETFAEFFRPQDDPMLDEIVRQAYVTSRNFGTVHSELLQALRKTRPRDVCTETIRHCTVAWIVSLDHTYLDLLREWANSSEIRPLFRQDINTLIRDIYKTYADIIAPKPPMSIVNVFNTIFDVFLNIQ